MVIRLDELDKECIKDLLEYFLKNKYYLKVINDVLYVEHNKFSKFSNYYKIKQRKIKLEKLKNEN
jgi:hypothetical protein